MGKISGFLGDRRRVSDLMGVVASAQDLTELFDRAHALGQESKNAGPAGQRAVLTHLVARVLIAPGSIRVVLNTVALHARLGTKWDGSASEVAIDAVVAFRKRGVETKLMIAGDNNAPTPDDRLIELVVRANGWLDDLSAGNAASLRDIATRDRVDPGDVSHVLPLAFLAPDIVEAILAGRHPPELTAARLKRMGDLPLDWPGQRRRLGFA